MKEFVCGKCGGKFSAEVHNRIDVSVNPELKEEALSGRIFIAECPLCGEKTLIREPLLYTDPDLKIVLLLSVEGLASSGEIPGYTARIVHSAGDFVEKLKIFTSGLDDIAVEMCKFVTAQELGKDVQLRFVGIEGADNEMTFTYPENGQMQMLRVGFNVYEDCAGIVSRNPVLAGQAKGLVLVDQAWLSKFIG